MGNWLQKACYRAVTSQPLPSSLFLVPVSNASRNAVWYLLVHYPHNFNDSIMTTDETLDESFFSPLAAAQELSRTFCILCFCLVCCASVSHNLAFVCAEERGILALWMPMSSCQHCVTLLQVNTEIREISRGLVYQPAPLCRSLLIGGDQQSRMLGADPEAIL